MHSTKNYATVEISPSAPVTSVTSAFFFLLLDRGGKKIRASERKALLRFCLHGAGILPVVLTQQSMLLNFKFG